MISIVVPSLPGYGELNVRCVESFNETATTEVEAVLVVEPNSFAVNVNKGLKRAKGDVICVVNNDCVGLPGWDGWVLEACRRDVGVVSFTPRADCGWAFAGGRGLFERVGDLDENLVNSYDDYDFFIRAAMCGYGRVLAGKYYALHMGGTTLEGVWGANREQKTERLQQCLANREYMLRKWPGLQIDAVPTGYWGYHGVEIVNEWKKTAGIVEG